MGVTGHALSSGVGGDGGLDVRQYHDDRGLHRVVGYGGASRECCLPV